MTDALSIGLTKLLRKAQMADDVDFLREGMRVFSEAVMELEVTQQVGAERHARTATRTGQRNGYRERRWDTRVGTIDLQVPRVRDGSYFPALLDPRRRAERALVAVVQEAYVHGVSTRRIDDLVQALGIVGISKSEVSRLCATLDAEVERFRTRPLTGAYPYIWLDATYLKVRQDGRVVAMAVVIAIGVNADGRREILGLDVGPSEEEAGAPWAAWQQFLRGLVERGLSGVRLVISDAHAGLKRAVTTILHGTSWQRCRLHFVRNALALVPKGAQQLVAATIRTVFAQPDAASAREQWRRVADGFRDRFPRLAALMDEAEADVLSYLAFPSAHWRQIWSNNPLERLNKEVKRRTDVVGIFPNDGAVIRLVGMILSEQHDEWQVSRCYFSAESLAAVPQRQMEIPALIAN
jgi:transposase-like protein